MKLFNELGPIDIDTTCFIPHVVAILFGKRHDLTEVKGKDRL
jgi:hypothetical protein